jgi:ribosomal-protein-alanine N-acetyltransferase
LICKDAILTTRLRIAPFAAEHLTARYVGWLNDPDVARFSEQRHSLHTLESCRHYWRSFEGTPHYFWAIVAQDSALGHIGNINAYVDALNQVADVGILIGERSAWGNGYGSEAWQAVCNYLLGEGGMRKVTAGTLAVNIGMRKVMERTRMVPDGCRARQCLFEGREVDVVYMARFREEQ